jgi:hypothetical protein
VGEKQPRQQLLCSQLFIAMSDEHSTGEIKGVHYSRNAALIVNDNQAFNYCIDVKFKLQPNNNSAGGKFIQL